MLILGEGSNGATVSEVANRVGVTVPATSRQLRRLERRHLVVLARDEDDRRAARARLTLEGIATRDAILAARHQWIQAALRDLRVPDATLRQLAHVADALDHYR